MPFQDYLVSTALSLNKGINTITFTTGNNKWFKNRTAGCPGIDCLKITSPVKLEWGLGDKLIGLWEDNKELAGIVD